MTWKVLKGRKHQRNDGLSEINVVWGGDVDKNREMKDLFYCEQYSWLTLGVRGCGFNCRLHYAMVIKNTVKFLNIQTPKNLL